MRFWVYVHTCPNGKRYVGITTASKPEYRWKEGRGYKGQLFGRAVLKYGWDNITHEAWELTCESVMYYAEKYLIAYYHTTESEFGYNHTAGGPLGSKKTGPRKPISEEARERMRIAALKRSSDPEYRKKLCSANKKKWLDPEYRKKQTEARKGKSLGEEHRKHCTEANRRTANDPERLRKMSEAAKKRYSDPEVRKKMSEIAKKSHSDPEVRKHMSEAQKKVQKKVHADPEYRRKLSEAGKGKPKPKIKIKLPDGTIVETTKNIIVRWYINKGKKFEYVD